MSTEQRFADPADEQLLLWPRVGFDLGALGAWMALGLATSLIVLILIRQLWLWLS